MKLKSITYSLFLYTLCSFGQDMSKADVLFYEYSYREAINEYKKELQQNKKLKNQQYLNLADSYLKLGNYEMASQQYLDAFKRDSLLSTHYFNKMLQSFSKTSGVVRVKAFLATRDSFFSKELIENSEFNYELISSNIDSELDFNVFNVNGNSAQADFSPSFYNDKVLFTSGRPQKSKGVYKPSREAYLDIYVGMVNANGDVYSPEPFLSLPKSYFHKATPHYSKESNNIFYVLSNADGEDMLFSDEGKNTLAIGMKNKVGEFKYLLRDLNTSFYYPFYEVSTGKLYFAANFEDSYGGTDIYYVYTNNGQIMSAPVNLGPRVNSPGNEIAPYIFENSLYFSSDIFYGYGGMDVYKTNFLQDDSFSIPINLGMGVNSSEDDFGFIIKNNDSGGLLGYFSSNRKGGKGNDDIYGFNVAEKPGLKTIAVKGTIMKPGNKARIGKALIKVLDDNGTLVKEVYSNSEGKYQFEIPWRNALAIQVSKELHSVYEKEFDESTLENIQNENFDIELAYMDDMIEEKESQNVIKSGKFYFDKGRIDITPEIAIELNKVVDVVKMFPEFQLRIESYTDSRGGSSTNFKLSQNRSDAIKNYLLQNGVSTSNILYSVGYGEQKILNNCTNGKYCLEMLHNQNVRSLIVVLNYNLLH